MRNFSFKELRALVILAFVGFGAIAFAGCGFRHGPCGWYKPGPGGHQSWCGGRGPECKHYGRGYGVGPGHMMGHGYHSRIMQKHGWGSDQSPSGWQSMEPEQQEKWQKMRTTHLMETLELRKQLATKQIELETLWAQPNVDRAEVEKLSNEMAELQVQLRKERDHYLLQCREEFGDKDWACPGGRW